MMWEACLAVLTAVLGALAGFFWREAYELLKRIKNALEALQTASDKQSQEKRMKFVGPVDFEELSDEDKIEYLNP